MAKTMCWATWNIRNEYIWNNRHTNINHVLNSTAHIVTQWKHAQIGGVDSHIAQSANPAMRWTPPPSGRLKCNVDLALFPGKNMIRCCFVVRDDYDKGNILAAKAGSIPGPMNALDTKALSCKLALQWLARNNFNKVCIESNILFLVSVVKKSNPYATLLGLILHDCKDPLENLSKFYLSFVWRSANQVAHHLTKTVGSISCQREWCYYLPPFLLHVTYQSYESINFIMVTLKKIKFILLIF